MAQQWTAGHRQLAHTADVRIEAWAPTPDGCIAQAVAGMVDSFADVPAGTPETTVEFDVDAGAPDDVLVAALDEVIYLADTTGRIPVLADVASAGSGVHVRLRAVDADRVRLVGPVPKAVSLHELYFGQTATGWSCRVTLDV